MRIRVRGTLTRVGRSTGHASLCIRLLPFVSVFVIVTALGILALSEMSITSKDTGGGVVTGGGAASRIMPGRSHSRQQQQQPQEVSQRKTPQQEKGLTFKMEPLLRRDAPSVELTAQMVVNRHRAGVVAALLVREAAARHHASCAPLPPDCPRVPPTLYGKLNVEEWLKRREEAGAVPPEPEYSGGSWSPEGCSGRHAVAIIIPFRDRHRQLATLMAYLHPILRRHQLIYRIFVVEQAGNDTFNKGVVMNAGALTALEQPPLPGVMFHCLIFHDVDMLPEDDRLLYTCPQQPRHLSVAVNELDYKLPYRQLVGGVFAIRTDHFLRVNGYSNLYWGWGGEDDDMGYRVEHVLSWISRPPEWIARYTMLRHEKRRPLARKVKTKLIRTSWRRYRLDGLNTVSYGMLALEAGPGYTRLLVDVGHPPQSIRKLQEEEDVAA